jgi:ferric-dicitrate binding protein FerR (iron transport regulator)
MTAIAIGVFWKPFRSHSGRVRTYSTTIGQRVTLSLADGSRVTLAPKSALSVSETGRAVQLAGEAFFDVIDNGRTPFVVQSGKVTTRVLGTSFDIRHYATDDHVRVAVASGKVVVSAMTQQHPSIVLGAGSVGIVTDSTAAMAIVGDMSSYTDWTSGHLIFDRARVADVLSTMERWYGYKFRLVNPELNDRHVTTTLDYNAAEQALRKLELLLDVNLVLEGDSVVIRPRRRSTQAQPRERFDPQNLSSSMEVGR